MNKKEKQTRLPFIFSVYTTMQQCNAAKYAYITRPSPPILSQGAQKPHIGQAKRGSPAFKKSGHDKKKLSR